MGACLNCGRPTATPRRGRCTRCAVYWYRHGAERPASHDLRGQERPCVECGRLRVVLRHGRCDACEQRGRRAAGYVPPCRQIRACETCGAGLKRTAPDYQTLCGKCSTAWLASLQEGAA